MHLYPKEKIGVIVNLFLSHVKGLKHFLVGYLFSKEEIFIGGSQSGNAFQVQRFNISFSNIISCSDFSLRNF